MSRVLLQLALAALLGAPVIQAQDHGDEVDDMGPAAFMWPPDREWFSFHDNVEPCGAPGGPTNRTDFPLTGGKISLVQQDESFDIQVAISYSSDPQANGDFDVLISPDRIKELDPGHQCLNVADPPSGTEAGGNATLQIKYTSEFNTDRNETYYACADIVYVAAAQFNTTIPCFNVTEPEPTATPTPSSAPAADDEDDDDNDDDDDHDGSGGGLSGGGIAGIVIGSVVGVSALGVLLFFLYRRDQREKRLAEHRTSARGVKWDEDAASRPRASGNSGDGADVELQDVSPRP